MAETGKYYKILGIQPGASLDEIKEAYRDLAKVWHPDRFSHDLRLQQKAQEKLKEINEAYSYLGKARSSTYKSHSQPESQTWQSQSRDESASTQTDEAQESPSTAYSEPYKSSKPKRMLIWGLLGIAIIILWAVFNESNKSSESIPLGSRFERSLDLPQQIPVIKPDNKEKIQQNKEIAPKKTKSVVQKSGSSSIVTETKKTALKKDKSADNIKKVTLLLEKNESQFSKAYFTVGSTKDEVLAAQGKPDRMLGLAWFYGSSSVTIYRGKVISYDNQGNLKAKDTKETRRAITISQPLSNDYFAVGSKKEEVLAVQGKPDRELGLAWYYGSSSVTIYKGKVVSYDN